MKADLAARVAELEKELDGLRAYARWVHEERQRIMADNQRRFSRGQIRQEWVAPTNCRLEDDPLLGRLHARDPAAAPYFAKPTTVRGRYIDGKTRNAGPGSYIGRALCGWVLMADELWINARHLLRLNPSQFELCGMCSYLSGQ